LLLLYIIVRLSYGTRMMNSSLIQIHHELEEAAYVSGGSTWNVVRRILVPILTPPILYGWLWIALLTYRELTIASLLVTPANVTLPMVIWGLWQTGSFAKAAAAATMGLVFMLPFVFCYWLFGRRLAPAGWQT